MPRDELVGLHRQALRRASRGRSFVIFCLLWFGLGAPATYLCSYWLFSALPLGTWMALHPALVQGATTVVVAVLTTLTLNSVMHSRYRFHLRCQLCEHGREVCLKCGYWLRGLGDDVKQCPECGAVREPMAEPTREAGPDDQREEGPGRLAQ